MTVAERVSRVEGKISIMETLVIGTFIGVLVNVMATIALLARGVHP